MSIPPIFERQLLRPDHATEAAATTDPLKRRYWNWSAQFILSVSLI
jgi:hypothetical protein